jgi:hypothetical protein
MKFFDWEGRPAVVSGGWGGDAWAILGGKFGSGWTAVDPVEVSDSGHPISADDFNKTFGRLPPLPTDSQSLPAAPSQPQPNPSKTDDQSAPQPETSSKLSDAQMYYAAREGVRLANQAALYGLSLKAARVSQDASPSSLPKSTTTSPPSSPSPSPKEPPYKTFSEYEAVEERYFEAMMEHRRTHPGVPWRLKKRLPEK